MGTSSRGNNVHRGWPAWTCRRPHALPPPAVAGPLAVPWPAIPDRWGGQDPVLEPPQMSRRSPTARRPARAARPRVAWQVGRGVQETERRAIVRSARTQIG